MAMRPVVLYATYATRLRGEAGDIITFVHFEEGNVLSETQNLLAETRDNTESGKQYDDDSTMLTLISEEEMDVIYSGDDSDAEPMSMDMLEYIPDGVQSHPSVNRRKSRYIIRDSIKLSQL